MDWIPTYLMLTLVSSAYCATTFCFDSVEKDSKLSFKLCHVSFIRSFSYLNITFNKDRKSGFVYHIFFLFTTTYLTAHDKFKLEYIILDDFYYL